jgi:hypothetical protein
MFPTMTGDKYLAINPICPLLTVAVSASCPNKEGEYNGANTVFVVQMFGTPRENKNKKEGEEKTLLAENRIESKKIGEVMVKISEKNNLANNTVEEIKKEVKKDEVKRISDQVKIIQKGENFLAAKKVELPKNPENIETIDKSGAWGEVLPSLTEGDEVKRSEDEKKNSNFGEVLGVVKYADFWENLVFNSSFYIEIVLILLSVLVLIGILIRMFIEYERQHYRHFLYAALIFLILLSLAIFNYHLIPNFG